MLLVFEIVFSFPVISHIQSIGGGGRRGRVESWRRAKATIRTQKSSAVPSISDIN